MLLVIDGRCDPMLLPDTLMDRIPRLCRHIGMVPVGLPQPTEFPDGWTYFQLITTSHIVIHTQEDYINIDIFSCKDFAPASAIGFCRRAFNIKKLKSQVIPRKFGKEIEL